MEEAKPASTPTAPAPDPASPEVPSDGTGPFKSWSPTAVAVFAIVLTVLALGLVIAVLVVALPAATPTTGPPGGGTPPPPPPSPTPAPLRVDLCRVDNEGSNFCTPNNPTYTQHSFDVLTQEGADLFNSFVWAADPLMGLGGMNVGGPYFPGFGTYYAQRDGADHGVGMIDREIFYQLGEDMANAMLSLDNSLYGYIGFRYSEVAATAEQFVTIYDLRDPYETDPPITMYPMTQSATFPGRIDIGFWPKGFFPTPTCPDPALACTITP